MTNYRIFELTLDSMISFADGSTTPQIVRMRFGGIGTPPSCIKRMYNPGGAKEPKLEIPFVFYGDISTVTGYDQRGEPQWSHWGEGVRRCDEVLGWREIAAKDHAGPDGGKAPLFAIGGGRRHS